MYSSLALLIRAKLKKLSTGLVRGVLLNTLVNIELRGVGKWEKNKKNNEIKMYQIREMSYGYP